MATGWFRDEAWALPRKDWLAALKLTWSEIGHDNIGLIAAGVAFYAFAAIVPLLASVVLVYGLVADAATVNDNIRSLFTVLPADAAHAIGDQLATVVKTSGGKKGFGLFVALLLALYGATKGTSAMVTALNVAFGEQEQRGFLKLNLLAFAMVIGAVLMVLLAMGTTAALTFLESLIPGAPDLVLTAIRIGSYLLLALFVVAATAALYRFAPSLADPRFVLLTPGAAIATVLWLGGTALFGLYVAHFGNYGATYGSLGAVVVLLTWLWLSAYVFLAGAELNNALSHPENVGAKAASPMAGASGSAQVSSPPPAAPTPAPAPAAAPTRSPAGTAAIAVPALLAGMGLARLKLGSFKVLGTLAGAATILAVRHRRDT